MNILRTSALVAGVSLLLGFVAGGPGAAQPAKSASATPDDVHDVVLLTVGRPLFVRLHVLVDGKPHRTAWNEFMQRLFRRFDKNADGVLSKDETDRMLPPHAVFGGGIFNKEDAAPMSFEKDKLGKVTLADVVELYRRNGGAPLQGPFGSAIRTATRVFDKKETIPRDQRSQHDIFNDAMFAALDVNKDGKLSREELAAAPSALLRFDENDDEVLTAAELQQGTQSLVKSTQVPSAKPAALPMASVVLSNSDQPGQPIGRRLLSHYGTQDKAETRLGREQLHLDEATFQLLDADGNGELDQEELNRFCRRAPDLELTIRLGKADGKPRLEIAPATKEVPFTLKAYDDGSFLSLGPMILGISALDSESYAADSQAVEQQRTRLVQIFRALDTDGNGYLDPQETKRFPSFSSLFRCIDLDGNGKIDEEEMLTFFGDLMKLQVEAHKVCATLQLNPSGRGLFDLFDANHDGRLGRRELASAVHLIAQLDRNGDGQIGRDEIPQVYSISVTRGSTSNPYIRRVFGSTSGENSARTAGPLWFRKMDLNRDGDVSRREFLGTAQDFDAIDTDRDGLISPDEATRADEKFRKR